MYFWKMKLREPSGSIKYVYGVFNHSTPEAAGDELDFMENNGLLDFYVLLRGVKGPAVILDSYVVTQVM